MRFLVILAGVVAAVAAVAWLWRTSAAAASVMVLGGTVLYIGMDESEFRL